MFDFLKKLFRHEPQQQEEATPYPREEKLYTYRSVWLAIHFLVKHGVSVEQVFSEEPPEGRRIKHLIAWMWDVLDKAIEPNNTKGGE